MKGHIMNRTLQVIIISLLIFTVNGYAQIVITPRDVPREVGAQFQYYAETGDSLLVNVGTPGGPQTWDFTQGSTTTINTDLYLDPQTSPPEYSRANVVIETDQLNMAGLTEPGIMYCYLAGTRFIVGAVETEYEGETIGILFNPYITQYPLPLQMGNTWSNDVYVDETFSIPGAELRIELTATLNCEVDAYGTVQVPAGDFEALRIRNDVTYDLTVSILIIWVWVPIIEESGEGINYDWRAVDQGTVLNVMSNTNDPYFIYANSVRRLMGTNTATGSEPSTTITSVETPETFTLFGGYPNPFNDETVISFSLEKPAHVDLRIFDVMGRQVVILDQSNRPEGVSEVRWKPQNLTAGPYFVQFKADHQVQRQMIVYLK